MPDLLLELFSEEIPARMQANAARELERLAVGALSDRGMMFEGAKAFAGPRRLTLAIAGLPAKQADTSEERKGPRVGAPQAAIDGFLKSAGVTLAQCGRQSDGKGEFYVATIRRAGRPTADVLSECLPQVVGQLPWPKSMRWAAGNVRWVRPLHAIVCTFDGEVVPLKFGATASGNTTFGHRFLSQGPIEVRRFDDYEQKLRAAHVILNGSERAETILHDARQKAFALGLDLVEDAGLLEEIVGLAEWPVVLIGKIEDRFMALPPEILQTSMRTHQKYFALQDPKTSKLANRFVAVANTIARDGGSEIVAGNERVLRARLSDAAFFWEQDRKRRLDARLPDLKAIVFHAKAGTMDDRACRIGLVAMLIAATLRLDVGKSLRAGLLAKADLVSGVVGEFPELQGVMGRYYALHDGEDGEICDAIRDHYKPLGPSDRVPPPGISAIVALADKIDSLVTLWRAGEKPTGSKDPFALRRAALGIIRIVLENRLRLSLTMPMFAVIAAADTGSTRFYRDRVEGAGDNAVLLKGIAEDFATSAQDGAIVSSDRTVVADVLAFLAERLKVAMRDKGIRHDLIDAVFSLGGEDDFVRLVARVDALGQFLQTEDGTNLLAGYRRAINIVKIEEKKDGRTYTGEPDPALLAEPEEKALFTDMATVRELIAAELQRERFAEAMTAMARLRRPVDTFFERVMVNVADAKLRENRLLLLSRLRATLHAVADFSKIEG